MPEKAGPTSKTEMRRSDRGVTDESWIRDFLKHAPVGILATSEKDQPYINSNLFAYDAKKHVIYLHTAQQGRTVDNIKANPNICFHIFEMGRMLPADEALEFSVEYAGVTIFGQIEVIDKPTKKEYALQLILDKYAPHLHPGKEYRPITLQELARTAVFAINIQEWSAKIKAEIADFPAAYNYTFKSILGKN